MRKYLLHVLIISFVFLLTPTVSFADADRIFKLNSKAVVMVTAYDEEGNIICRGSGFIVKRDGVVVTNYHVIGMASDIKVKAGNKIFDVEGLIFTDKINDLAILKARAKNMPVVKLGVIGEANIGEHVYVIGYPLGLENTISVGLLRGIREIDEKREILQITAPVSPGSSGSPVFNSNGEVIGVATTSEHATTPHKTRNLAFAISVKLIKNKFSSKSVIAIKDSGLEDYINTAMYWNQLGLAYGESGKYKEAIKSYKQAISIDPDYAKAHSNLGYAYGESGRYEEAIKSYKQAIRIDPDDADAHNGLGAAYGESGKYEEAIESYKQALRIDPDLAGAHYNLGLDYGGLGKYKKAIKSYKQVLKIDPDFKKAHKSLGDAYGRLDKYKKAIKSYKQAIRLDPDYRDAHDSLGYAYNLLGKYKEAIESFKQAIRLDPDYADAHDSLGYAYLNLGKFQEAIESCKQAISIDPDFVYAHSNLGLAYHYSNDRNSALEQYKILKELDTELANELFDEINE